MYTVVAGKVPPITPAVYGIVYEVTHVEPSLETRKPAGAATVNVPTEGTRYEPVSVVGIAADDVPVVVGGKVIGFGVADTTGGGVIMFT